MKVLIAAFVMVCAMALEPTSDPRLFVPKNEASNWLLKHKVGELEPSLNRPLARDDLAAISFIATVPQAFWVETRDDLKAETEIVAEATRQNKLPVFVTYAIPGRDNGNYSAGGFHSPKEYADFVDSLAKIIGKARALIVLEPDALCLARDLSDETKKTERFEMLGAALLRLKQQPNVKVYHDAGHPNWLKAEELAEYLNHVGIAKADGFSLNVSNYELTEHCVSFGEKLSKLVHGKHFVIDTSRNGQGSWKAPESEKPWCNPPGRGLGTLPTANTGNPLVDAYLWVKCPGESDGECRGGPGAGEFWPARAVELYKNRKK